MSLRAEAGRPEVEEEEAAAAVVEVVAESAPHSAFVALGHRQEQKSGQGCLLGYSHMLLLNLWPVLAECFSAALGMGELLIQAEGTALESDGKYLAAAWGCEAVTEMFLVQTQLDTSL